MSQAETLLPELKHRVKSAVSFISDFEQALAHECHKRGFQGVVCGHIHPAEISRVNDIDYPNCGDWVESCTALIEHLGGRIELYKWSAEPARAGDTAAPPLAGESLRG